MYQERTTWTVVLYGPVLALVGWFVEWLIGGPTHTVAWVCAGLGLALITLPWVYARRRFLTVRVADDVLWQGREALPVRRIASTADVGAPVGARVLGGGWSVPRNFTPLPLRLRDGTVVLAWAKNPEALRTVLNATLSS
jgi:hypothetical protein